MSKSLADYPVGRDPEPCWPWTGAVRAARSVRRVVRYADGSTKTVTEQQPAQPVMDGGRRPFRKIAILHGVPLKQVFGPRPETCDPLCVNPFHRLKKVTVEPEGNSLIDQIKAFLPNATNEDDIFDEFLLRGNTEEDIHDALEKIRAS